MNIRAISRNIGVALLFVALIMFASAAVSAVDNFDSAFSPLMLSGFLTFTVGIFPLIFVSRKNNNITTREGLVIIFFAWLLCCIFGMMPYALWGGEFSLINSWFESVSGYTTTGATILNDIEGLPKSLLFYRSATHYIGGLGVVLFMVMILPATGTVRLKMSRMEVSDVSKGNFNIKTNELSKSVGSVYIGLTLLALLLFMLAGMSPFDALNHALSCVTTGGFSTRNASIGAFNSRWIELITIVITLCSSLHFGLIYKSFSNRSTAIFKDPIVRFFLITIVISTLLICINLLAEGIFDSFGEALWQAFFNVVSIGTSSGFATCNTAAWPLFSILILLYMAVQCGCSGSTSGGLRADRIWILAKAIKVHLLRTIHPNAVIPVKYGKNVADGELVSNVALFAILYMMVLFVCMAIYAALGLDLTDSFTSSTAMISNVGPAFGNLGSLDNYSNVPSMCKFLMGIEMLIGRLGLYSTLVIIPILRKK